ncbi:MAG: DoxX family protein [Pseudomonadota bacterium]
MKFAIWLGMALVSLILIGGGLAKLAGQQEALGSFEALGLATGFATFVGIAELSGAVGLWIRQTSMWAAIGISIVMAGAIYYHVLFTPLVGALPAFLVLSICGCIIFRRGTGVIG